MVVTATTVITTMAVISAIIPAYITRVVTVGRAVIAIVGRRRIGRVVGRVTIIWTSVIPTADANPNTHTNTNPRLGLGGKPNTSNTANIRKSFFIVVSLFKTLEGFD
jgi:hypothetical protein